METPAPLIQQTAPLNAAAREILAPGYRQLVSTFLLGNDASVLWHWRCGFRLATPPEHRPRLCRGGFVSLAAKHWETGKEFLSRL
jgi:L-amino acid N-acyltransferase YncA